jgi:hypothetical protein
VVSDKHLAADEVEIARAVLRYLQDHPAAKDTLDGIAQWWLLREWSERKLKQVERAVSFLVSQELVVESSRVGLPPCYQINRGKHNEISNLLKASEEQ